MATKIAFEIDIKGSKEVLELQKQIKQLKADLKTNNDPAFTDKALKDLALLEVRLKESQRQARIAQAELTAKDSTIGSYARLSASLVTARERFKELASSGKASAKEIEAARNEAARLDAQLKKIDANTGVFGRNVGNYANSLKGLFGQLKGALSQSLLVGNIRNIPQLLNLVAGAYETVVKAIDDYRDATDAAFAVNKKINKSINENVAAFSKDNIELQSLFETAEKTTQGSKERNTAIQAINETYGQYLPNLLTENSTLEEIDIAQTAATEALIDNTLAKIQNAAATEIVTNLFKEQLKIQRAETARNQGGFVNFINELNGTNALGIEILEQNVAKTGKEFDLLGQTAESTKKTLQDLAKNNVSLFDAFGAGSTDAEKKVKEAAQKAAKTAADTLVKEAQKEAERIKKVREDAAKAGLQLDQKQAEETAKLNAQISQLVIDGIEDEGTKALAQEELNFALRQTAQKAEYEKLVQQIREQEARLLEAFGAGSKQVLEFREQATTDILNIQQQFQRLESVQLLNHQAALKAIENKGIVERNAEADKAEKDRTEQLQKDLEERLQLDRAYIAELDQNLQLDILKLKEALAKKQITIEEAAQKEFEARKKALAEQLAVVKAQLANETQLTVEQQNDLVLQAQKLNTELAELEEAQTAKVIEEGEKQKEQRKKNIEFALNAASDVLDAAQSLSDAVLAIEENRLQKQLDVRNQNIASLEESLANQTGLEAAYTQQRIDSETIAARKIERAQQQARKRAAIANKAFAVAQAGINVALGVTAACFLHYRRFDRRIRSR